MSYIAGALAVGVVSMNGAQPGLKNFAILFSVVLCLFGELFFPRKLAAVTLCRDSFGDRMLEFICLRLSDCSVQTSESR